MTHVLIVDDDDDIRETLGFALGEEGYTVSMAPDGNLALSLIRQSTQPLVVILDHLMPGLNGMEILRIVAKDPQLASRHAYILLSASREAALDASVPMWVRQVDKPFSLDVFLDIMQQAASALPSTLFS